MNRKTWVMVFATASLAGVGLGVHRYAGAQDEQNPNAGLEPTVQFQSPGAPPPPPDGGFPGGPPPGRPDMMMGGGFGGPTQIAASGNAVFVLRGNTIHRLNAATLRVEASGQLPQDPPNMGGGPGNMGGIPPGGGRRPAPRPPQ